MTNLFARTASVVLSLTFLSGPFAMAQSVGITETSLQTVHPQAVTQTKFSIGLHSADFKYTESKMTDTARLNGLVFEVDSPLANLKNYFSGQFEYLGGSGTYDGQTWGDENNAPIKLKSDTKYSITTLRGLFAFQSELNENNMIVPFAGLGLRYLLNTQSGPGSYKREINYVYLPVGVSLKSQVTSVFSSEFTAEYDVFVSGTVKSHLSETVSGLPDIENTQKTGSGYRLSANFKFLIGRNTLGIQPFYHQWKIAESDHKALNYRYYVSEPENETKTTGLNVSMTF